MAFASLVASIRRIGVFGIITNLRATFAAFVVAGCAVIAWFSLRQDVPNTFGIKTQWAMVSCVLLVMALFAVVIVLRDIRGLATDGDADAYYYLGFIYTLATLIGTFAPLLNEGAKPTTQQVLGFFGLGLITTFVGLAGRILILQGDGAQIAGGPDRLSAACLTAAAQLDQVTKKLAYVAAGLDQIVTGSHQSITASLQKTASAISSHTDRAHAEVSSVTADAAKRITSLVEASSAQTLNSLEAISDRLTALRLPDAALGDNLTTRISRLTEAIEDVERGFTGLKEVVSAVEAGVPSLVVGIREVHTSASEATTPLAAVAEHAEEFRLAVERLTGALEHSLGSVRDAHARQGESAKQMSQGIEVISQYQTRLSELSQSLSADLKASEDAVRKVHQNLVDATEFITQRIQ